MGESAGERREWWARGEVGSHMQRHWRRLASLCFRWKRERWGHTNQVHVFNAETMLWSEPIMKGVPPIPRDSHSCTTVGDSLFVFGGFDGRRSLNDLHILQTPTNTWVLPSVRGDGPEPREGHRAALIGKRLFIFGGCGKSESSEIHYDDLYILNTETFLWKRVFPSGTPPSKRVGHTYSSWKNKIIVIGGEESSNSYPLDVHILDADTLVWCKLNTTGQLLPPRAGHTTINLGKNLIVFGGFLDEQNFYNDVYMLDIETGAWIQVPAIGEGHSGRFYVAGENLDPQMGGVLVFIGGCNQNFEPVDELHYLHTGISGEMDRDDKLKLKCQEQHTITPGYDKSPFGLENEHDTQADDVQNEIEVAKAQVEIATSETKDPAELSIPQPQEVIEEDLVPGASEPHLAPDGNAGSDAANNQSTSDAEMDDKDVSAVVQVPGASEPHLAPDNNAGSDAANNQVPHSLRDSILRSLPVDLLLTQILSRLCNVDLISFAKAFGFRNEMGRAIETSFRLGMRRMFVSRVIGHMNDNETVFQCFVRLGSEILSSNFHRMVRDIGLLPEDLVFSTRHQLESDFIDPLKAEFTQALSEVELPLGVPPLPQQEPPGLLPPPFIDMPLVYPNNQVPGASEPHLAPDGNAGSDDVQDQTLP